jgi:hypothetical protein
MVVLKGLDVAVSQRNKKNYFFFSKAFPICSIVLFIVANPALNFVVINKKVHTKCMDFLKDKRK